MIVCPFLMRNIKKNIAGIRVRKARLVKNMTQDQLSARLARMNILIDRAGISKIETGARCVYDYELKAIAKVMEVTPEWFISD